MQTFTKDMVPWKLRGGKPTGEGALTQDEVSGLRDKFALDFTALRKLSITLDMALSKELHITQYELGPARVKRGVRELQSAIKELSAAEKKLRKVETILQGVKFKHLFRHTRMPHPAIQRVEEFAIGNEAITRFRLFLEAMAREELVFYTGMPDKRLTTDIRRNIVCVAIFNFWDEAGRKLSYTTAPGTSERGGELVNFVNAVVLCMTDPPCRLSGEVIKAELEDFKPYPGEK
jgi:hypothetical protein